MQELRADYTVGFLTAAHAAGMTKAAAAELLMHGSVLRCGSPGYIEGFYAHGARPVLGPEDFEKSAGGVLSALRGIPSAIGKSRLGQRIAGSRVGQMVGNHPKTVGALAGIGTAGAAAYGLRPGTDRDINTAAVPFLPGAYDAAGATARAEGLSDAYSSGVFDLNKRLNGGTARQLELEAAVAAGGPESHMAAAELRKLKSTRAGAAGEKMRYTEALSGSLANAKALTDRLEKRRQTLQTTRDGGWFGGGVGGFFRRLAYNMNGDGLNADDELDQRISGVEQRLNGAGSGSRTSEKIISDQLRRLGNGSTAPAHVPSTAQVQRNFFPTY